MNDMQNKRTHFASGLEKTEVVSKLFFTNCARCVNLVAENEEGDFGKLLNGKESVEFGLGFRESLKVGRVDEEDDTVDFREVVAPETACWET